MIFGARELRDVLRAAASCVVIAFWLLAGCGGERCRDADGDARGDGCARGPDCDDRDPRRAVNCPVPPPKRCVDNPTLAGCPCYAELDDACYGAPAETVGVGACRVGHAACAHGVFLACEGAVLPRAEACNELDDDCDGVIDEWVASPCGGCNAECVGDIWGPPVKPFEAGSGLAITQQGELTLERIATERRFVWVPNTDEGTLSKIDAERALEVARYRTPAGRPLRVAIDQRGDAWVLDSPRAGQAHLAKYASEPERCVDLDRDGLRTSHAPDQLLEHDECQLLDIPIGAAGDDAQALAVDGALGPDGERAGHVWVGFGAVGRLAAYEGALGLQLVTAALPDFAAYAGSFDSRGRLWLIDRSGGLARVDPSRLGQADSGPSAPAVQIERARLACFSPESIWVEPDDRLLFAGFGCENVISFDPRKHAWSDERVPGLLSPRALARSGDALWVVYTSGQLGRVSRDPLALGATLDLATSDAVPYESITLAADGGGKLWIVSTQGGADGRGLVTRFDPVAGQVTAQISVGLGPRGAGDLTGQSLGLAFTREAVARHVFSGGCSLTRSGAADATRWRAIHVVAEVGSGGAIDLATRWAPEPAQLAAESFEPLGSFPDQAVFPLAWPDGGTIEVQLTLRSEQASGAPRIARIGLEWTCAGPQ